MILMKMLNRKNLPDLSLHSESQGDYFVFLCSQSSPSTLPISIYLFQTFKGKINNCEMAITGLLGLKF